MPFKTASSLTKFHKREVAQLFCNIELKFRNLGLEILLAPRSLDYGRLLICVARRFGNAPKRNLFKRRVRAIFYENKLYDQKYDWVFVVKSKASIDHDFTTISKLVHDILSQITKAN